MSDESLDPIVLIAGPAVEQPAEQQLPPPELGFFAPPSVPAEKLQALDTVFADEEESADAAGLMSAWGASMILHDFVQDAKARKTEEEAERERQSARQSR